MVANLVGIAMAMVLALIPPGNYGGDPGHIRKVNHFHWQSVQSIIEKIVSLDNITENHAAHSAYFQSLSNIVLRRSASMQELASDFQKDAERLQSKPFKLPAFKVDPRLKVEIGMITRDIYVASFIPLLVARIIESESDRHVLVDDSVQTRLKQQLEAMKSDDKSACKEVASGTLLMASDNARSADVDLLLRTIDWLVLEMCGHDDALQQIKWGL